jgi:hypothetical protein
MRQRLFLLGGHDLEMHAVRRLLGRHGRTFADRALSWENAKLSAYADLFDEETEFIAIELQEDVAPPPKYRRIDHHGELSRLPSSLEQVAELLGAKLSRFERLIAANDRGYIPAMQVLCASKREIRRIRCADRRIQGVTPDEERQAVQELEGLRSSDGIWEVETSLKHTSALVDRIPLERRPLIVYGERHCSFYGDTLQIEWLAQRFEAERQKGLAYYGGGFFGFAREYFDTHSVAETKKELREMTEISCHSRHIFMLPFTVPDGAKPNENGGWEEQPFQLDTPEAYNEYTYFHPFVRKALFQGEKRKQDTMLSSHYAFHAQHGSYTISRCDGNTYELVCEGVTLRHFEGGVGILSLHLKNTRYPDLEDVLAINDYGRRIFPPFLGKNFVEDTKQFVLSDSLGLHLDGEEWERKEAEEDFTFYSRPESMKKIEAGHRLPSFIRKLLARAYGEEDAQSTSPIIDDRMYTMCHYLSDEWSSKLTCKSSSDEYAYMRDGDWYRFVFVDGGGLTCRNPAMLRDYIAQTTYARWADESTLFGVSRYSFMLLTDRSAFARETLNTHLSTVYFQIASLALAYRAMILKYSDDVTTILDVKGKSERKKGAQKLFEDYLRFKNNLYFQEVTAQEQGIELFDMLRGQMRLDHYLNELDRDIDELHNFIQITIEDERNDQGLTLNLLAALFLPASIVAGILGMNTLPKSWSAHPDYVNFGAGLLTIVITIVIIANLQKKE